MSYYDQLRRVVSELLSNESGCPWLLEQDFRSLAHYSLEEVHELIDSIEKGDIEAIKAELADLCFHLIIYTEMKFHDHQITWEELCQRALRKLEERQSRGDSSQTMTAATSHQQWQKRKYQSRYQQTGTLFGEIPSGFPAYIESSKILEAAEQIGFKYTNIDAARAKITEELAELDQALEDGSSLSIEHELGDVMLACASLSRQLKLQPDQALRRANRRLKQRLQSVERRCQELKRDIFSLSKSELLAIYTDVKSQEE